MTTYVLPSRFKSKRGWDCVVGEIAKHFAVSPVQALAIRNCLGYGFEYARRSTDLIILTSPAFQSQMEGFRKTLLSRTAKISKIYRFGKYIAITVQDERRK